MQSEHRRAGANGSRRAQALRAGAGVSVPVLLGAGGCGGSEGSEMTGPRSLGAEDTERARLRARPQRARDEPERSGLTRLDAGDRGEGLLYVPANYSPARPAPLVVLLHGAGSNARSGLAPLLPLADEEGVILFAPQARGRTWDLILGDIGPDVTALDALLSQTFDRLAVDRSHVALGGFSDGASYALSLGLANGDLFSHLIAFSPGFIAPAGKRGRPAIYVSHGVADRVLPIERCSRRIVPSLRRDGYDVDYREFGGGHAVPTDIARAAVNWLGRDPP